MPANLEISEQFLHKQAGKDDRDIFIKNHL